MVLAENMIRFLVATLLFTACHETRTAPPKAAPSVQGKTATQPVAERRVVTFAGTCDASGAVELDERHVLVADDENNVLRIYDTERGGAPRRELDLSAEFQRAGIEKTEVDLEAGTRLNDKAYFLASHGRTSKGKRDDDRLVFFAIRASLDESAAPVMVGQPYRSLLDDLLNEPRLARFGLGEAALLAPKAPGGLNLEGLVATSSGTLLMGFRNPVPEGRALLVGISNPEEVLGGARAKLTDPIQLDLGGLGIRAMSSWHSSILILAGPSGEGGPFRLYRFDGQSAVVPLAADLSELNAEAIFAHEARNDIVVLSDDGSVDIDGKPCKKHKESARKSFRGLWLTP